MTEFVRGGVPSNSGGDPQISQKTSVTQQLPDGSCVRKTLEVVDGESSEVTEQVDCQQAEAERQQNAQKVEDDVYKIQLEIQEQMGSMMI